MQLLPLDTPRRLELAAGWLVRKENHQWLDFGGGHQPVTPTLLKIMAQRSTNFIRAYATDADEAPIGIVGLHNIDREFGSATFWGLSGEKSFRFRGLSTVASSRLMTVAFGELGLHAINTWAVEGNPSVRTIERLGFRCAGRLRQCHRIDGRLYDRLLFDLLAEEHVEIDEATWHRLDRTRRQPGESAHRASIA